MKQSQSAADESATLPLVARNDRRDSQSLNEQPDDGR